MVAKFEVYKDNIGEWRWRLKAPNGEIIAHGEGYTNKNNAIRALELLNKYSPIACIDELNTNNRK